MDIKKSDGPSGGRLLQESVPLILMHGAMGDRRVCKLFDSKLPTGLQFADLGLPASLSQHVYTKPANG